MIEMILDFEKRELRYFGNDENQGVAFTSIDRAYRRSIDRAYRRCVYE